MPSRRLSHDRQLEVLLAAMLARAWQDMNGRPLSDDVSEIVETAGDRTDLLAEAVGLHTLGWADSRHPRQRELGGLLSDLDLPGVDRWYDVARERAARGTHTAESLAVRLVDLPGVGQVRSGELPGL